MDTEQVTARSKHWCLGTPLHRLKRKVIKIQKATNSPVLNVWCRFWEGLPGSRVSGNIQQGYLDARKTTVRVGNLQGVSLEGCPVSSVLYMPVWVREICNDAHFETAAALPAGAQMKVIAPIGLSSCRGRWTSNQTSSWTDADYTPSRKI